MSKIKQNTFGGILGLDPVIIDEEVPEAFEPWNDAGIIDAQKYIREVTQKHSDDLWRKLIYGESVQLPTGKQMELPSVNESSTNKRCYSHEWVNVGFHHDKWVCKKCDMEKP